MRSAYWQSTAALNTGNILAAMEKISGCDDGASRTKTERQIGH
jgi:hypothetical protein